MLSLKRFNQVELKITSKLFGGANGEGTVTKFEEGTCGDTCTMDQKGDWKDEGTCGIIGATSN